MVSSVEHHKIRNAPECRQAPDSQSCAEVLMRSAVELGKLDALEGESQVVQVGVHELALQECKCDIQWVEGKMVKSCCMGAGNNTII